MKRPANKGNSKPVTIGGKAFPSVSALARFIGRQPKRVRESLEKGGEALEAIADAVRWQMRREAPHIEVKLTMAETARREMAAFVLAEMVDFVALEKSGRAA